MPYKFLLVSRRSDDAYKIREELERNRLYEVEVVETAQLALKRMQEADTHCVVLNLESFTIDKMKMITDLRDLNIRCPVILMATYVQPEALQRVQTASPTAVVIEKPFEAKDLWGIAQKLVQGVPVPQRIHRRFYTNQITKVEKLANGHGFMGRVYNLSKGGAYVEIEQGRLQVGEVVTMSMQLSKVSRAYNVDAEVVWSVARGIWKGRPAVGLRFVKPDDVYRNMLQKL